MSRSLLVSALCVFLLAGCGDSRKPTVQEQTTDVTDSDTPVMPPGHGMGEMGRTMPAGHGAPLGPEVRLGVVTMTAPDTWVRNPPRSGMVIAEFSLPHAEGDTENTRLAVTSAGGTIEQNIARWKGQFGGSPASESVKELEVSGVAMTVVDFSGTFGDAHMGPGATAESSGTRMIGAIFKAGGNQFFLKCIGPANTVGEHADEVFAFLKSLKPSASHGMGSGMGRMPPGGMPPEGLSPRMMPPGMMPPGHGTPAATEEPTTEQPATEEPATEQPAIEEPATEQPATEEPDTEEPASEQPVAEEPATEQPASE